MKPRFEIDVLIDGIGDGATRIDGVARGKEQRPRDSNLGTAIVQHNKS